jgi:hypothetical protein
LTISMPILSVKMNLILQASKTIIRVNRKSPSQRLSKGMSRRYKMKEGRGISSRSWKILKAESSQVIRKRKPDRPFIMLTFRSSPKTLNLQPYHFNPDRRALNPGCLSLKTDLLLSIRAFSLMEDPHPM